MTRKSAFFAFVLLAMVLSSVLASTQSATRRRTEMVRVYESPT